MTRQQEIRQEAIDRVPNGVRHYFVQGAEWADEYPAWRSVEDELPASRYDLYLTCTDGNVIEISFFDNDGWHTDSGGEITHWMPLPQPPRTKREMENLKTSKTTAVHDATTCNYCRHPKIVHATTEDGKIDVWSTTWTCRKTGKNVSSNHPRCGDFEPM